MPQPFEVRDQDRPGTWLGSWDEDGNITLPGSITVAGGVTYGGALVGTEPPGWSGGGGGGGALTGWVDLKAQGVPWDGLTDGRAAAQALINAAGAGATIYFAAGTLAIAGELIIPPFQRWIGSDVPFQTKIKVLGSATGMRGMVVSQGWNNNNTTCDNPVWIEGIDFDGNRSATAAGNPTMKGLILMNWQSTIIANFFENMPSDDIYWTDRNSTGIASGNLTNTAVENRIYRNRSSNGQGSFLLVESFAGSLTDGFCIDNLVASANGPAIRIKNSAGWLVAGNHPYTGGGRGGSSIWCSSGFSTKIINNYVDYYGQTGTGQFYSALRLDQGNGNVTSSRDSLISGNQVGAAAGLVASNTYRHIDVELGSGTQGGRVAVHGNEILGSNGTNETGIYIFAPANAGRFQVHEWGNTLTGILPGKEVARVTGTIDVGLTVRGDLVHPVTAPSRTGMLGTGMIPNSLGTQLYPQNSGSGLSDFNSDGGRCHIQGGLRTVFDSIDVAAEYGNFMTRQSNPGEIWGGNKIRVSSAVLFPFGTPKSTAGSIAWSNATAYAVDDVVTNGGQWYVSIQAGTGHTPPSNASDAWWRQIQFVSLYTSTGSRYADIEPGGRALFERAGIDIKGQSRMAVITTVEPLTSAGIPVGQATSVAWSNATTYAAGDIVYNGGRYYESLQGANLNHTPPTAGDTWWSPIVYPYGLGSYPAATQPDMIYIAAAGSGRPTDYTTPAPAGGGTQVVPTTLGTTTAGKGYGPITLLSTPTGSTYRPVIIGQGDSIFNGAQDANVFVSEPGGYFIKALTAGGTVPPKYSHFRINKSGDAIRYWYGTDGTPKLGRDRTKAHYRGATHAICEMATNDMGALAALATLQVPKIAEWKRLYDSGIRVFQVTCTPQTTSTDSWATTANQTPSTNFGPGSFWEQFNAWLVAGAPVDPTTLAPVAIGTSGALLARVYDAATGLFEGGNGNHPLYGVVDIVPTCCDAVTTWAWKVNGAANFATADGIHPSIAMYTTLGNFLPIDAIAAVPFLSI